MVILECTFYCQCLYMITCDSIVRGVDLLMVKGIISIMRGIITFLTLYNYLYVKLLNI